MAKMITRKRVNIILPQETIHLIDQLAEKGYRSRFLNEAVQFYVKRTGRANLKRLLREGAFARRERDLALAQEWFPIERKAWQKKRNA